MMWMLVVLSGMGVGLGLTLIAREMLPVHTRLDVAIGNLSPTNFSATARTKTPDAPAEGIDRLGAGLERLVSGRSWATAPEADLDLLGLTTRRFWTQKALMPLAGFLCFAVFGVLLSQLNLGLPISIPFGIGLIVAGVLWFAPNLVVRDQAKERREEFAFATVSYLRLVAIRRLGHEGVVSAMSGAARISDQWMFSRIRETLQRAQWSNIPPWDALDELADDLQVPELHEIADITRLTSSGGSITDSLMSRAASMRDRLLSKDQVRASDATTSLSAPLAVLIMLFLISLLFPVGMNLLGS